MTEDRLGAVLRELGGAVAGIDPAALDRACERIAAAGAVAVTGCGREALQLKGLAMRLHHLGLRVTIAGDVLALPVGPGDLLIAVAGPGELATVTALMRLARAAGAAILFITAEPQAEAAGLADAVLVVPAQTMARDTGEGPKSVLPMGSVFEGALFVLFEVMVLDLRERLGVPLEAMRARHANLE